MQTDEGARTNLILTPQGQGINPFAQDIDLMGMAGQLISPDGVKAPNGEPQGTFPVGRLLTFNYFRRSGVTGSCRLVYATDGQSLKGRTRRRGRRSRGVERAILGQRLCARSLRLLPNQLRSRHLDWDERPLSAPVAFAANGRNWGAKPPLGAGRLREFPFRAR